MPVARWGIVPVLVALFLLTGCPGKITFTDGGSFGTVGSAVWVELDVESDDGEDMTYNYFLVSHSTGLCNSLQEAFQIAEEAQNDYWELYEDFYYSYDYEDYYQEMCDIREAYYQDLDRVIGKYTQAGSYTLYMDFQVDDDWGEKPDEDNYEDWSEDDEDCFDMGLRYYTEPFHALMADIADYDDGTYGYCWTENEYDDFDDAVEYFNEDGGDVTVEYKGANKIRFDFDIDLEDEEDDNAGDMVGWFTATHCPIEVNVDSYFYGWYYMF